jgi:hypothetical protein
VSIQELMVVYIKLLSKIGGDDEENHENTLWGQPNKSLKE